MQLNNTFPSTHTHHRFHEHVTYPTTIGLVPIKSSNEKKEVTPIKGNHMDIQKKKIIRTKKMKID